MYLAFFILIPLAYLLGSVPFGLIVGLARGVDPRKAGSGNIGATNVGRLLGGKWFAVVFILDLLKGLVPVAVAGVFAHRLGVGTTVQLLWLAVGFAAVAGHMFSLFLKFRGGKGVATSAGIVLGLFPYYTWPGLVAIAVWLVLFLIWRYVSLASMLAAIAFPICFVIFETARGQRVLHQHLPLLIFAVLVAGMILVRHRSNFKRLLAGTEHRFSKKDEATPPAAP